ncbi:MAG: sulfatase [Rufibacter sp.]
MNKLAKRLLLGFLLAVQVNGAMAQKKAAKAASAKPNILFFLVDDLGWKDLTFNGSTFYETPNIDALAKDGMVFTRAYAACPVCSPTRASIMTGKFPVRTGVTDFLGAKQQNEWERNTQLLPANYQKQLALEEVTVAEALKEGGYQTFFAGKWHLGGEGFWPENQGFDINMGGVDKGGPGPKGYFSPYRNQRLPDGPEGEYLPERLANETASFIQAQKNKTKPFFIYHSFYLVHTPLNAKKELLEKYERKRERLGLKEEFAVMGPDVNDAKKNREVRLNQTHTEYAAMVEALDQAVGKIIAALKAQGLYDNTVIVFTSDNGGLSTSEGWPTSNVPLRGGKGWAYEGGIREPLLVRWPGVIKPGSTSQGVVSSADFYPTLLEIAGLPFKPKQHLDGQSMVPLLKGGAPKERTLFWHYPHYGNQGGAPFSAVMEGDFKLIWHYENGGKAELFNVKSDLSEKQNLAQANPSKVKAMKRQLDAFLEESNAKFPVSNPYFKP